MKLIQNPPPPTIGPRTADVDAILNLQDVLNFLIDKGHLRVPDEERRGLVEALRDDARRKVYGTATANVVSAFRKQFLLPAGESVDEPTADALNKLLRESGALDPPPEADWIVRGQVTDDTGPRDDVQVNIFDRDLFFRREQANAGQLLGTGMTKGIPGGAAAGSFEISYATSAFAAGDYVREGDVLTSPVPDLIFALSKDGRPLDRFRIYRQPDADGMTEEVEVSADDLILGIQARRVEDVRIAIAGGEPRRRLSEYEQVWRAVEKLLPEGAVAGADDARREALVGAAASRFDEGQHRDISFVVRETGLDPQIVRALRTAFRLAADPFDGSLPASVLYGVARSRNVSDLLSLSRLSTDDLRRALQEATAGDLTIIPPFASPERLEDAVQAIRTVIGKRLPEYRNAAGSPSLKDLIGADLPNTDDQATLWRTYSDHTGTSAEFWQKLRAQPGFGNVTTVSKLQYSFKLGVLARNNMALVNAIRARHAAVVDTVELAFHLDTADKWRALIDAAAVPVPADVPGKPEEQKGNYAASLAAAMQVAHPTASVASMISGLPATHLANTQTEVATFFDLAVRTKQFDLVTARIDDVIREHGDGLLGHVAEKDRPAVIAQVKRVQRLFRLSDSPTSLKALLDAGFDSARDIAELPPDIAMEMLRPLVGEPTARLIVERATHISAAAVHQYVLLKEAVAGDGPRGAL